jgi:hypothetical protein
MSVTAIEGVVEDGLIRLPNSVHLPENAKVYVVVPDAADPMAVRVHSPRLVNPEQAADFNKEVVEEEVDGRL